MRYCQAGLNHIWLRNDSRAQVCCSIPQQGNSYTLEKPSDFLKLINDESFIDKYKILETSPIKKQCDICVKNEKNVGHSQRHKINDITKKQLRYKFSFLFISQFFLGLRLRISRLQLSKPNQSLELF